MPHIPHLPPSEIPEKYRVPDNDNIIQIHGIHGEVMRAHYDLYIALMRKRGPLTRVQREMIAVAISAYNQCHY